MTQEIPTNQPATSMRRAHAIARIDKPSRETFRQTDFHSIGFVGSFEAVPTYRADGETYTLISPWLGSDWEGKAWANLDRSSPLCALGLLCRLWFDSKDEAKRLMAELPAFFGSMRAINLRGDWYGLPADVDLVALQLDLMDAATRRGLHVFDDETALNRLRG